MSAKRYVKILVLMLVVVFRESSPLNGTEGGETAKGSSAPQFDLHFNPRLGITHYMIELNGVDIGTGLISMQREGNIYKIHYEVRTNKKVDRVFKARYKGEGIVATDPLKPVRAELHQRVRSKTRDTIIYFEKNGRIMTKETRTEEGNEPKNRVRETRVDGLVLDPLSAAFLLQGIDWDLGKEKVLKVFSGKSHYETRFTCVNEVSLENSGKKWTAWVIKEISRNLDEQPENKDPGLRIYVSAEGYHDVLKVETARKMGQITLTLDRFEPAPDQASP